MEGFRRALLLGLVLRAGTAIEQAPSVGPLFLVSMVVSPKGSIEYFFLYASYKLFDSSVRPEM